LEFWAPKTPPLKSFGDQKKSWKKKGHKHHPPKKGTGTSFFTLYPAYFGNCLL
jgi:hypothetical protein